VRVEFARERGAIGDEVLEAPADHAPGEPAVGEGDREVAECRRVAQIALPARDGELVGEVAEKGIGDPEVAFGVLEADRVDLVRHRRGADLAGARPLAEDAEGHVAPDVPREVEGDRVHGGERVAVFGDAVVGLDLGGERVGFEPKAGEEARCPFRPGDVGTDETVGVVVADRAAELGAERSAFEPCAGVAEAGGEDGPLLAEGGGARRLAVGAREHGRPGLVAGRAIEPGEKRVEGWEERFAARRPEEKGVGRGVDVLGGAGEVPEGHRGREPGVGPGPFAQDVLDGLHVVGGRGLPGLDRAGVVEGERAGPALEFGPGPVRETRKEGGLEGVEFEDPGDLDPPAGGHQGVFAEERAELVELVRVASVKRRESEEGVEDRHRGRATIADVDVAGGCSRHDSRAASPPSLFRSGVLPLMSEPEFRIEHDSMGPLEVPRDALWGAQTERARRNFPISGRTLPAPFLHALAWIKAAAARANRDLGLLDEARARAIEEAALEVAQGRHDGHFPLDVYQTGSGTSSNMNVNEVVARLAGQKLGSPVHPNDHVNMSQSSNDTVPSAIHVAALVVLERTLAPALETLAATIAKRARELRGVVKTGRTHLMDAVPLTLGQELGGWEAQVRAGRERLLQAGEGLRALALGGTAVGTGLNAPEGFAERTCRELSALAGTRFAPAENYFRALSSPDAVVAFSGALRTYATSLMKIANDLRWMNSGPLSGLGEIALPALQPGSSIMPGKVNPVVPEAAAMVAAQAIGLDTAVAIAGQSGNFQLNVMLPLLAADVLESETLLAHASALLAEKAIAGFVVNERRLSEALARNPILVTALNTVIGYEKGAAIAKEAYRSGRSVREVALEMSGLGAEELDRLLDPLGLTTGGIPRG
jgi:fumarate hydratase class II